MGYNAGCKFSLTGDRNILIGCQSGCGLDTGDRNVYIGVNAGGSCCSVGNKNIGIGNLVGRCLGQFGISANYNIFMGDCTARQWTQGDANTVIGKHAANFVKFANLCTIYEICGICYICKMC